MTDKYLVLADLTGQDFSQRDLSGWNLGHTTIDGCKFGNCLGTNFVMTHGFNIDFTAADITDTTFEKADQSVLNCLVGATWNSVKVTHVSEWFNVTEPFTCFATNAFVQVGCKQRTMEDFERIGKDAESIKELLNDHPDLDVSTVLNWWKENAEMIRKWYRSI